MFLAPLAFGQDLVHFRGTVQKIDGMVLVINAREGGTVSFNLGEEALILTSAAVAPSAVQSGKFIGAIGLWYPEGWPELELGYWLVPEAYGKGYATEAGRASKEYAFDVMGAQTLVSYIEPTNKPSISVAERLGGAFDQTIELLDLGHLLHCG